MQEAADRAEAHANNNNRSLGDADDRGIFANAWAAFETARAALTNAANDAEIADAVPDLAVAYLCLRNALPLVAIQHGATADSGGEAEALRRLRQYEQNPAAQLPGVIAGALWRMLSLSSLADVYDETSREYGPIWAQARRPTRSGAYGGCSGRTESASARPGRRPTRPVASPPRRPCGTP